mmetsp:Transcript_27139/g.31311  ORF Transcript_27139/g.31311 Transcript_27139/m.31311 type:complete len:290 (+) Transcript_27139:280-1149(+)
MNGYQYNAHFYKVGTFQNPLGALTTSSWSLRVYDSGNNIIMQTTSGITATTTVNSISVTSSTRNSDTKTVGIRSEYYITFTTSTRMLSGSTIMFKFPKDQILYDSTTTCYNGATNLACTFTNVDSNYFQTEITQWCNTGGECAASSSISLTLKQAINPGWILTTYTSSVSIFTINNALTGSPTIDQVTSNVKFSPSLIPGTLTNINVLKDATTNKVGESTTYTLSFTVVTVVPAGGQVKFTFPSKALYKDSSTAIVCKDSAVVTKTCTSVADSTNNVSTLTITDACTSG